MPLSRGPKHCLELLEDLARGSLGCACPSREWLARRLDCSLPTLDRWTAELRAKGFLTVKKRQHSSATYTVQTSHFDKSGERSGDKSERRYIGRVKLSEGERRKPAQREERCLTAAEMWPEQPRRTG